MSLGMHRRAQDCTGCTVLVCDRMGEFFADELKELREQRKEFLDKIEDILAEQDSFKFGNNEFTFQEKKRQVWNKKACMEAAQDGMLDVDQYAEGGEMKRTLKRKRLKD